MNLTIITPPDYYHRSQYSSLVINPSQDEKQVISDSLKEIDTEMSVYLYQNDNMIEWLINSAKIADSVYINVDNSKDLSYYYISYLVSQSNVTWNSDKLDYSIINREKVRNINEFIQQHWLA